VADDDFIDPTEELTDELAKKYDPERLLKVVAKRAGRGDPLEHSVRQKYERRFGVDLGHVRIYSGEFAQEFNRQRNAYAVTIGSTGMVLMGGSAEKTGMAGEALLAHELTHVAQQAKGLHRKASFSGAMPFAEEHEHEADSVEHAVMQEMLGGAAPAVAQSGDEAADLQKARVAMEAKLKKTVERIKQRVIELMGDTARNHATRGNGQARRA
jgi:Domain of unknown function (DUF4157)